MARRAALALLLAALAAGWVLAAWALWQTEVPDDLRPPAVAEEEILPASLLAEAEDFERFARINIVASILVLLGVFVLYARYGVRFARESAAGRIGTGILLAMLGFALVWLAQLPFGLIDLWWQRRHDVTDIGYVEWLLGSWFSLGAEFIFLSLALVIVMGLAGPLRRWWWVPGGAVFVGLGAFFVFISPYLLPGQEEAPPDIVAETRALEEELGLSGIGVRVQETDPYAPPNAAATGLGDTRRIILWETLVDSFSDEEVRVVIGHELAHHARDHLPKGIAWYALFAFPGAFIIAVATRRRGGMADPAAVPLALLVLVVLQLVALPANNAFTRNLEEEADWVALETTEDPDAARGLFEGFSDEALIDPSPPGWSYLIFETHPALSDRIAMAEAWRERNAAGRR